MTQERFNREMNKIDRKEEMSQQMYYINDIAFFGVAILGLIVFYAMFDASELIYRLFDFGAKIVLK